MTGKSNLSFLRAPAAQRTATSAKPLKQVPATGKNAEKAQSRRVRRQYKIFSVRAGMDMPFLFLVVVLLLVGLVMLFSASYAYSYYKYGNSTKFISQQAIFACIGLAMMLGISLFDYHHLHKFAVPILCVAVVLLIMVKVFAGTSLAPIRGGANRWLNVGVEFQPSEVAKFALILMFAHSMSLHYEQMGTFRYGVVPYVVILAVVGGLVIAEKHVSATMIIGLLAAMMMFIGGTKLRYFAIIGAVGAAAVVYLVAFTDKFAYAMDRIYGWIDPFNPPAGVDTWQTRQSLYAIGSGQLLGVGLGQSRQKFLWLPEPQNDFIFAIICEELGFVGALIIIILFVALIWRGIVISLAAKDKFGTLLGIGITMQIGLQAALNIMVVTNTIPNTGISLPFFSYGGSSLVMLLCEIGVVLSISRTSNIEKT